MAKEPRDPGDVPPPGATQPQIERWRRERERFLTEGGRAGVSQLPASVDPTDRRLKQLRTETTRFLELHSPMKASIWLALQRPAKDIIHSAEMSRRFRQAQSGETPVGEYIAPDRPAIIEIGEQLVAAALGGDVSAIDRIADRIEGKAGLRVGDEDPEDPARRRQSEDLTARIMAALTRQRLEQKSEPQVIDVKAEVVDKRPTKRVKDVAVLPKETESGSGTS